MPVAGDQMPGGSAIQHAYKVNVLQFIVVRKRSPILIAGAPEPRRHGGGMHSSSARADVTTASGSRSSGAECAEPYDVSGPVRNFQSRCQAIAAWITHVPIPLWLGPGRHRGDQVNEGPMPGGRATGQVDSREPG